MDELTLKAIEILERFDGVSAIERTALDHCISFCYLDTKFLMTIPKAENNAEKVGICVEDGFGKAYPHIMLAPIDLTEQDILPKGIYHSVCLYESNSVVFSLLTFEEKIRDAMKRLSDLLSMSPSRIEREYQKEFLYYWNQAAMPDAKKVTLYIDGKSRFSRMNLYESHDKKFRLVMHGINLSDKDKVKDGVKEWKYRTDVCAFFIPLSDSRGVLPPTKGRPWGKKDIIELIYSKSVSHIEHAVYNAICQEKIKTEVIILVFEMTIDNNIIDFSMCVRCIGNKKKSLRDKLFDDIERVDILRSQRMDLAYLHFQIGNDVLLLEKKVLVVGAGSLGSYIIRELCNNGFSDFTIYDGDNIEPSNMMRWAYSEVTTIGGPKADLIKWELEFTHPQIKVQAVHKNIDRNEILKIASDYDLIIFTVGSTDVQLECNKGIHDSDCMCPIFFAWLEAGGNYSHILKMECGKDGCYECLCTGENGELVNNRANREPDDKLEKSTIHNGCGATRVAYGTAVILRTVSGLLSCIKEYFHSPRRENYLLTIDEHGEVDCKSVYRKECRCCGHKN